MRRVAIAACLLASACPRSTTTTPPDDPIELPPVDPTPKDPTPARCGDADDVFVDAAALPADASLVAVLAGDAPTLDAALGELEQHVRGSSGLAVPTAFVLQQWRWEVPLVRRSFAGLGVETGGLASVQLARIGARVGDRVWAAPLACPVESLVATLAKDFEIQDSGGIVVATPRDRTRFVHDVVVRPDVVVLCPEGAARRVIVAWDRPVAPGAGTTLRQHVFELGAAAVRIAIRETGLLPSDVAASDTATHLIRVDADGLDATLAP